MPPCVCKRVTVVSHRIFARSFASPRCPRACLSCRSPCGVKQAQDFNARWKKQRAQSLEGGAEAAEGASWEERFERADGVFSSPLTRAMQTAVLALQGHATVRQKQSPQPAPAPAPAPARARALRTQHVAWAAGGAAPPTRALRAAWQLVSKGLVLLSNAREIKNIGGMVRTGPTPSTCRRRHATDPARGKLLFAARTHASRPRVSVSCLSLQDTVSKWMGAELTARLWNHLNLSVGAHKLEQYTCDVDTNDAENSEWWRVTGPRFT